MLGFVTIDGIDSITIKTPVETYRSELGKHKDDDEFILIKAFDVGGRPKAVKADTKGCKVHVEIISKNEIQFLLTHKRVGDISIIKDRRINIQDVENISMNETAITYVDKYGKTEDFSPKKKTDIIQTKDGSTVIIEVVL